MRYQWNSPATTIEFRTSDEVEDYGAWLERERLWEERLAAIQNFYLTEHEKQHKAADERRRAKLKALTAELSADICKTEKETLPGAEQRVGGGNETQPLLRASAPNGVRRRNQIQGRLDSRHG